jgi:hypothetical protein
VIQVPCWTPTTAAAVEEALADRARTRSAVRLPSYVMAELSDPARTTLSETSWSFLVGGWTDPVLASLPPSSRDLQIGREIEELTDLGLSDLIGYVPSGWEPELASLFAAHGIRQVAVGASPPLGSPMVTDHLGDVVIVLPLVPSPPSLIMAEGQPGRAHPPIDRFWAEELDANPEAALLYRKMLRLATRIPERPPTEAVDLLLDAQAGRWYQGEVDRSGAHAALINARRRIDQERRVPADWTRVTQLDWDADGVIEAHLENPLLSIVVDPAEGLIKTVDLKNEGRALSYVPGEPPWRIARALSDHAPARLRFDLESVEEARELVTVRMSHPELQVAMQVRATEITLEYRPGPDLGYQRLGPEMVLALGDQVRMRVDGGAWNPIEDPAAHPGHRFRFDDGTRQVLVSLNQPGDLFVTRLVGGVVVWANWPLGPGEYRLSVALTG